MSNLTIRVLVAVVGIPLILLITVAGGYYFFAFVALASTLALRELYALARTKGALPQVLWGTVLGLCIIASFIFVKLRFAVIGLLESMGFSVPTPTMSQYLLILFLTGVPLLLAVELFRNKGSALLNLSTTILGMMYVSMFFGSLVGLRELFVPEDFPVYAHFHVVGPSIPGDVLSTIDRWGACTVITMFAAIWTCDSAAFFVGRAFGRHKLFPRISPNKTWEGAAAGFVTAVLVFMLGREIALPYLSVLHASVCGAIVGLFGQIGDLAESLLKRDAGVKDSSAVIPGHGGVLDRFDSLMYVSPLLFVYLDFVVF